MSAIRTVISYFWSAADWLDTAGSRCDNIPVVGSAVGYPLHASASYLRNSASALYDFDSWVENVRSDAITAYYTAVDAYNMAAGTVYNLASGAWTRANEAYNFASGTVYGLASGAWSRANEAYNFAASTVYGLASQAWTRANDAYNFAASTVYSLASQAWTRANEAYNSAQAAFVSIGPNAWSWITAGYLQAFLSTWSGGLQAPVLLWVENSIGYLMKAGFTELQRSWSSFQASFIWLIDEIIVLIGNQAAHFADSLWWLFEEIVKRLTEWEGY